MVYKKFKIEINFGSGFVDVSTYFYSYKYQGEINNRADVITLNCKRSIKTSYTLTTGLPIKVYEGWETTTDRHIFTGIITSLLDQYSTIIVDAADEIWKLSKESRVNVYNADTDPQAGVISAIAEDLMDEVIPTIVEDSGTDLIISQFISSNKTNVLERATKLANVLNYIILYDPEVESAYFVSRGYFRNTRTLTFPVDSVERVKWTEDATKLFNDLTYYGGTTSAERTQSFSGTGSETTFEVDITPSDSVKVEVEESSVWVEKKSGTPGVSITYDYYIDKANKKIIFNSTSIPASGTDNIRISLSAQIPPTIHLMDEDSIQTYNLGTDENGDLKPYKKTITEVDITNNNDALVRAKQLLAIYSTPFFSTTIQLKPQVDKEGNYKLGEMVSVVDSDNDIEQDFMITKVERNFPGAGVKLTLGDLAYRLGDSDTSVQSRLSSLESELSGDTEVLADFRTSKAEMTLFAKSLKITSNSVAGEYGIWDHPLYGIWDTSKWAPDTIADTGGFILGHSIYGVLGTSKLGESTDNSIIIEDEDYE